jgi:DNA-3-methyladenine glycosylase I
VKAMAGVGMPAQLATVVTAADGVTRCRWATETGRDLTVYHDHEWGVPMPTHDEAMLFEALVLTYFENGLSWTTCSISGTTCAQRFTDSNRRPWRR